MITGTKAEEAAGGIARLLRVHSLIILPAYIARVIRAILARLLYTLLGSVRMLTEIVDDYLPLSRCTTHELTLNLHLHHGLLLGRAAQFP